MKKLSLLKGLTGFVGIFLNTQPLGRSLGVSYPEISTQTLAQYVSANAQVQEQLWVERVLDTNGATWQTAPFSDGVLTGRVKAGEEADDDELHRAIVEITDTSKVRGDTINLFSESGIGGEGAYGDQVRNGTEAQIVTGNMQVTIGNQLFSAGYKQSAVDKTMIGQNLRTSPKVNNDLRNLHCIRKNDTIIWRMLAVAGYGGATFTATAGSSPNLILPSGVANREALRSANTLDLPTIMAAGDALPGLGGMPMSTVRDSGGSVGNLYMFFAADKALYDFEADPQNNTYLQYAAPRDKDNNPLFAGGFYKVRGHGMYRWTQVDHATYMSIGSPLCPRAKLSVATTNTAAQFIQGGGVLAGASTDTVPQWFKHFSNAPVVMYGGVANIVATTSTVRYIMIIGSGGYSVFGYTVNNGNKITTSSQVVSTATSAYVHNVGDLIVECNSSGCLIGRSLMFGAQAVVGGIGSINGNPAAPEMGRLIEQKLDMENDISIGVEGCAGYSAVKRAGDGIYNGFVVCEHAMSPLAAPGAPTV